MFNPPIFSICETSFKIIPIVNLLISNYNIFIDFYLENNWNYYIMINYGKLVLYGGIHQDALEKAQQNGFEKIVEIKPGDLSSLEAEICDAEALALRYLVVTNEIINKADKLKLVSRHGVGTDNIDLQLLTKKKIPVWITGDVNSNSVAEHAFSLMSATAKSLVSANRLVQSEQFSMREDIAATDIAGKTLLIVGYGRIGKRLAKLVSGFEMEIIVCDPFTQNLEGVEQVELNEGLARADFVSLHIPSTGKPLICKDQLKQMKSNAIIVNTSRGDLINLNDLGWALNTNQISGVGLDVFPKEPPEFHPLFVHPRVSLSPHSAAMTDDCMKRMGNVTIENIVRGLSGDLDQSLIANARELGIVE